MKRYEIEIAKLESRTPLFYYPYHIELKSDLAKEVLAAYFYKEKNSYALSFRKSMIPQLLTEENLKKLSGQYTFQYDDPNETEGQRIAMVKHAAPRVMGYKGVDGFLNFKPNTRVLLGATLEEEKDFEVVVGERVEIEQPKKLTFEDIPDLMGVNE